jgi:hypothetical protein
MQSLGLRVSRAVGRTRLLLRRPSKSEKQKVNKVNQRNKFTVYRLPVTFLTALSRIHHSAVLFFSVYHNLEIPSVTIYSSLKKRRANGQASATVCTTAIIKMNQAYALGNALDHHRIARWAMGLLRTVAGVDKV